MSPVSSNLNEESRDVNCLIEQFTKNTLSLKDYQLDGLKFFIKCHDKGRGAILADEMGLGKTCQAISFLVYLVNKKIQTAKMLVICPLSVIDHWKEELKRFGYGLKPLVYYGNQKERENIIKDSKEFEWNIILTTYEMPLRDASFFKHIRWNCCVVDEGHRLKNDQSLLHNVLKELKIDYYLLLTGTPVQNDLDELYSILSFTDLNKFSAETKPDYMNKFKKWKISDQNQLRNFLSDYMLRRTKDLVCNLPEMSEVILYHGLSDVQKNLYVAILMKNLGLVDKSLINKQKLLNTLMQLRKCVGHPYLFDGIEPEPFEEGDHLIFNSGKLMVLDALLSHLSKTGHKVLIFSQMVRILDIVQDYMTFKNYTYERLDGSVRGEERFASIKRFNKNYETFAFLLSTRAGGLGLTLTSADTVVFLDSDFNPQNDIQASARAHRIGQNKYDDSIACELLGYVMEVVHFYRPVKVIRLIARDTVEEYILQRAYSKLRLTNIVLGSGNDPGAGSLSVREISDILMHGFSKIKEAKTRETQLNESELVKLIGKTDEKTGFWLKEVKSEETPNLPANLDFYDFEGENYRKYRENDRKAFDELVSEQMESAPKAERQKRDKNVLRLKTSELDSAALERQKNASDLKRVEREQKKKQRKVANEVARLALWRENNYQSTKLLDVEDTDEIDSVSSSDDQKTDIHYLVGDVTEPVVTDLSPIVVHCVDNSGEWGSGGLFDALKRKYPEIDSFYSKIESMKDLDVGDVHIFDRDFNHSTTKKNLVALAVTQNYNNRDSLNYKALESTLNKLSKYAIKNGHSVHLARIGYGSSKFDWYSIERLIRKCFCDRNAPVYIYYYKRRQTITIATGISSDSAGDARVADADFPLSKKLKIDYDNENERKKLTDLFTGMTFAFQKVQDEQKWRRLILAYDGQLGSDPDNPNVTHIVVNREDDFSGESDSHGKCCIPTTWIEKCIKTRNIY